MTKTNIPAVDVQDHDGSTKGLYLGGTLVTALPGEIDKCDMGYQLVIANGAITIKNGIVRLAKTDAGAMAITLANPVATTDDYKTLVIINFQAQANTVEATGGSYGGGGAGENVATFTNTIGNTLSLMAYQGLWYIIGKVGVAVA